ncbi:MAG: hypothetical protein C4520_18550 [Candidatus Abyssobacteria bacterium SURF_5]|uniref:Uncharacterized protein n=1 Tax=Abyssobacteria bacterium (strain SURF_5) TaxID=2093360 RepID=A0A3A4NM14_ABYX5|nr:MAG: hypothetical protein C4520_18550 [Candidatus Abyssubacteria bacterium SURF_5]
MKFKITKDKIATIFFIAIIVGFATANARLGIKEENTIAERMSGQIFLNSLAILAGSLLISVLNLRVMDSIHEILEKLRRLETLAEKGTNHSSKDSP